MSLRNALLLMSLMSGTVCVVCICQGEEEGRKEGGGGGGGPDLSLKSNNPTLKGGERVPQSEPPCSSLPLPPPPGVSEGSALLGAILVRIPFKWGQMANQSAAALG